MNHELVQILRLKRIIASQIHHPVDMFSGARGPFTPTIVHKHAFDDQYPGVSCVQYGREDPYG